MGPDSFKFSRWYRHHVLDSCSQIFLEPGACCIASKHECRRVMVFGVSLMDTIQAAWPSYQEMPYLESQPLCKSQRFQRLTNPFTAQVANSVTLTLSNAPWMLSAFEDSTYFERQNHTHLIVITAPKCLFILGFLKFAEAETYCQEHC